MLRSHLVCSCFGAALVLVSPPFAAAQATAAPPGTSLKDLFVLLADRANAQTGGAVPAAAFENVTALATLGTLDIATAPVGTSAGGFTFTFDKQLQTWTRSAPTFGPAFAERSLTTGRGKASAGFNWLYSSYNSLAGQDLKNGDARVAKNGVSPVIPIAYTTLRMDLTATKSVAFGVFGVTDDFDIGVVVPWIRVSVNAELANFTANNIDVSPGRHFQVPDTTASGVGDVALFGKYHFWHNRGGGLAGEMQVLLPTGDSDNFRGLGVTRTLLEGIWSQGGRISPHATLGYEFWSARVPLAPSRDVYAQNQFKYAFGVELEAHPRTTVTLDIVGHRLLHGGQLGYVTYPFSDVPGSVEELEGIAGGLNVLSFAPGLKWHLWQKALLTANLLATISNDGLKANVTPVIGLDWTFSTRD